MKRIFRFSPIIFFLFAFFRAGPFLFASGGSEEPASQPVNTQFVFCVTALDISALPVSRQVTGDTVVRSLADALVNLSYRFRGEKETAYYRDYAWTKSRAAAAKALAAKRSERDLLVFRGDPSWKYQKNLKATDDAIVALEQNLADIDALPPVVEEKPAFSLTDGNNDGTYPAAPKSGGEYRFCTDQKADAFLTGSLSEYHGRLYLAIKVYTLYTHSYSYEDSVLFSSEDLNAAMDEISVRLAAAVADTLPSSVIVHASPPDALILVDGSHAGRGELERNILSPGEVEVDVRADNHVPVSIPLELNAGELAEVFIDLTPLGLSAFEADVPDSPGSKVYIGGLYVGQTPLTLELPRTDFSYISVETPSGETGSVVYRDNTLVKGSAQFIRKDEPEGSGGTAIFNTKAPISPEEKRVDKARRGFYGVYGAFWFILPASLITAGIAGNYINMYNYVSAAGTYYSDEDKQKTIYNRAVTSQYFQRGAYGFMGVALGVTFFQIFRYLFVSGGDATPIVKAPELKLPEPQVPAPRIQP